MITGNGYLLITLMIAANNEHVFWQVLHISLNFSLRFSAGLRFMLPHGDAALCASKQGTVLFGPVGAVVQYQPYPRPGEG